MSFSPLPELFLEHLEICRRSSARILDLGCGDGAFFASLLPLEAELVGLDRAGPAAGSAAQVVGDARVPPLRSGTMDLVVAANLFRHIFPADPRAGFLDHWRRLLRPGGALFLFEDEPAGFPAAVRNYRRVQEFLNRLLPAVRGPLLARAGFERLLGSGRWGTDWVLGSGRNELEPDLEAVRGLLFSGHPSPEGEASRLLRALEQDGLAYGDFWWACWRADPA